MLKGHIFNLQTFTSEAFALFIDKFLNGRNGVARGCALSNTQTSVTIGDGYFVVKGRFLQIISGVTLTDITNNGFYSLICEIDLSLTNTVNELNQAQIKAIYETNNYPTLSQQDITSEGKKYQYEFARFKVENGSITGFTDRRTFIDFQSVYDQIEHEAQLVLADIQNALDNVIDGSLFVKKSDLPTEFDNRLQYYVPKTDVGTISKKNYSVGTGAPSGGSDGDIYDQYF